MLLTLFLIVAVFYVIFNSREKLTLGDCGVIKPSERSSAICAKPNACDWIDEKTRWDGDPTTATKCECIRCQQCKWDVQNSVCVSRREGKVAEYEKAEYVYQGDKRSRDLHKQKVANYVTVKAPTALSETNINENRTAWQNFFSGLFIIYLKISV